MMSDWEKGHTPAMFDFQPYLRGDLVTLGPLTADHMAALRGCAGDLRTWADYPNAHLQASGDIDPWFSMGVNIARALIIEEAETGNVIGTSRYYEVPGHPTDIGIGFTFLTAASRRQGATNRELKRLMLTHAFKTVETVWFHVLPDNARSQAAVKKLGAREAGEETLKLAATPTLYRCFTLTQAQYLG